MWHVATTEAFDQWFAELENAAKIEIIAKVDLLKLFGPQLSRPHADTLKGSRFSNMKELRADTATSTMRVAFAFDPNRSAILLVAGDKRRGSQKRFYKELLESADRLFAQHLRNLKKTKEE